MNIADTKRIRKRKRIKEDFGWDECHDELDLVLCGSGIAVAQACDVDVLELSG